MKTSLPKNIVNPFSDDFLETWTLWKNFKKEEFNFVYKGVHSEQVALMNLNTISEMNEEVAVLIIQQSIGEGWKGLFPLNPKYKTNGQKANNGQGTDGIRSKVNAEFNSRSYNRG